jgi:hypothetical protein
MAKKTKAVDHTVLLSTIVADTKSEKGYSLVDPAHIKELVDAGHIEVNPEIKTADGKIAARATAALLASHGNESAPVAEPVVNAPAFQLTDGIPLAPAKRGGKKTEEYPFSQMAVGQSFVVPATAAYPKPWETFASTVSSATRRFAVEHATETRKNRKGELVPVLVPTKKFTLRQITPGQTYEGSTFVESVSGARVFRIA